MTRPASLVRALTGFAVLSAVTLPSLIRLRHAEEVAECGRRRAVLASPDRDVPIRSWETFACPRRNMPYLFTVNAEGRILVVCPNGHAQQPIPLHRWVPAP